MALGRFEVHAGDFKPGNFHQLVGAGPFEERGGKLVMDTGQGTFSGENSSFSNCRSRKGNSGIE